MYPELKKIKIEIHIKNDLNPNEPEKVIEIIKNQINNYSSLKDIERIENLSKIYDHGQFNDKCEELYKSWMKSDL